MKGKKSISELGKWLDERILFYLSAFLLFFIPLYPKWPLIEILPGYIVRIRLEDFLVAFVLLIWLIQVVRKKINFFNNPLLLPIGFYLLIGFFSILSALFITKTIPFQLIHIGKTFLHYLRRIEYLSLFFVFYTTIKDLKQVKKMIIILSFTLIILSFYGFGQKYLGWPVYSTMNREFAKGWRLILTEYARVPATFAGHYDLAAYLAFFLIIFLSFVLFLKRGIQKLFFFGVFLLAFLLLILTASRTSFIAYLLGTSVAVYFLSLRVEKKIIWGLSRWFAVVTFSLLVMFNFGDLSERFANFFKLNLLKNYFFGYLIGEKIFGIKEENLKYITLNQDLKLVYSRSDAPPEVLKEDHEQKRKLPADVYEDIPDYISTPSSTATLAGELALVKNKQEDKEATMTGTAVPRRYSETAFVVGLSSAIRFDALWPMAIKGFLRNPLLGSGYATLNKLQLSDFTEAESTDNDYLRALGETGLLGFLTFYGIIFFILRIAISSLKKIKSQFFYAFTVGVIGGIITLLINATYIDVFEASKVAFSFWAMVGILLAFLKLQTKKSDD